MSSLTVPFKQCQNGDRAYVLFCAKQAAQLDGSPEHAKLASALRSKDCAVRFRRADVWLRRARCVK